MDGLVVGSRIEAKTSRVSAVPVCSFVSSTAFVSPSRVVEILLNAKGDEKAEKLHGSPFLFFVRTTLQDNTADR